MAEMVDAEDLGSSAFGRAGSIPVGGTPQYALVAQWIEQWPSKPLVVGSNPTRRVN